MTLRHREYKERGRERQTRTAEGDGTRVQSSGDVGRRLDVEHNEPARLRTFLVFGWSESQVVQPPPEGVHALLAPIHRHHHATQPPAFHCLAVLLGGSIRFVFRQGYVA